MNNIILYTTQDKKIKVELYELGDSVYLNQEMIAKLFDISKQNISLHIKNILEEGELQEISVVKEYLTTASDNKQYNVKFYSLEMILAIGFRVRSKRGVQFRIWANEHLKNYLQKGFLIDSDLFILASDNEAIKSILEEIESFITKYQLKGFKKTNVLTPLPAPKYKNTKSKERQYKIGKAEARGLKEYVESFDEDVLTLNKCVINKECKYSTLQEVQDFLQEKNSRIVQYGDVKKFDENITFGHIDRILNSTNKELREFVDLSDEISHYQKFQTTLGEDFACEVNEIVKSILNAKSEEELKSDFESGKINIDEFMKNLKSNAKTHDIESYTINTTLREHYYNPLITYNKNDRDFKIDFAIGEDSEKEFLQDLEKFLKTDSKKLEKYAWCFSKLIENIDNI